MHQHADRWTHGEHRPEACASRRERTKAEQHGYCNVGQRERRLALGPAALHEQQLRLQHNAGPQRLTVGETRRNAEPVRVREALVTAKGGQYVGLRDAHGDAQLLRGHGRTD